MRYRAAGPPKGLPLLFVHGAWHGAWCWEEHFLPYFSQRGYDCYALSLRGHGKSGGRQKLRWSSIGDYVADLRQVAESLSEEPLIIGHSMGGLIAQKYLERYSARGAALLASVPSSGALQSTLRTLRNSPMTMLRVVATRSLYPLIESPEAARWAFFSEEMDEETVRRYHQKLGDESFAALLGMLFTALPRPRKIKAPLLILGAERDTIFTVSEIENTARSYGTRAEIIPDIAHDMMLERNWRQAADRIGDWLAKLEIDS